MGKHIRGSCEDSVVLDFAFMWNCIKAEGLNGAIRPFEEMKKSGFLGYCLAASLILGDYAYDVNFEHNPPIAASFSEAKKFVTELTRWLTMWEHAYGTAYGGRMSPYPLTASFSLSDPYGFCSCLDAYYSGVPVEDIIA